MNDEELDEFNAVIVDINKKLRKDVLKRKRKYNAVLEAAASCVPTVGSRINGIVDSVVEGVTGILHEPSNVQELVLAMTTLAENDSLRLKMGVAARTHVIKNFSEVQITNACEIFYRRLGVI